MVKDADVGARVSRRVAGPRQPTYRSPPSGPKRRADLLELIAEVVDAVGDLAEYVAQLRCPGQLDEIGVFERRFRRASAT